MNDQNDGTRGRGTLDRGRGILGWPGRSAEAGAGENRGVWKDHARVPPGEKRRGERERESTGRVSVSGSSLLHFKPKRGHSSGFRRADVLYYCSVEIAILRLHSGLRACMRRFPDEPLSCSLSLLLPLSLSLFSCIAGVMY